MKQLVLIVASLLMFGCSPNKQATDTKESINSIKTTNTMEQKDYTVTILVNKTPEEAMNAITNIRGWWSEEIEGGTTRLNDEFVYHYKDIHYCKMKMVELTPNQRVVWEVLDNSFNFIKDKTEWIGTKLVFDITQKDNQTEVRFTHEGLVPQYECYELCREAWANYITESLKNLVTAGKGNPNPKDKDGYNAELAEKWGIESN